jgi:hypothetical protein
LDHVYMLHFEHDLVPNRFPPIGSKPGMLFEIKL